MGMCEEFFNKNRGIFETDPDIDENKHAYMKLYEEYIKMFDNIIDTKLSEDYGYSQEDIQQFVLSFAEHRELYESDNDQLVDLLFALSSFDTFTTAMKGRMCRAVM